MMTNLTPRRNDPCPCGSGKKYKKCCQETRLFHKSRLGQVSYLAPTATDIQRLVDLSNAGRHGEMETAANSLLARFPESGLAWKARAAALHLQGKEALDAYERAAALLPNDAEAHYNLGYCYQSCGRLTDAVDSYSRAIANQPDHVMAHGNLGTALQKMGHVNEAIDSYRRAIAIKPDYVYAHNNLATALMFFGDFDAVVSCCLRALEIKSDYPDALNNLGIALKSLGRLDEAIACFHKALAIKPDYADAHASLISALNFCPDKRQETVEAAREFDARFCLPFKTKWYAHDNCRDPGRRLRIGYASPDFRRHAVAIFAEPVFANHDKSQVEVFCYGEVASEDSYTERFRRYADHWQSTVGMSDDGLAELIRGHQIDILVDLAGHTLGNRLMAFARKPAPIQTTYLGYPGTTGLSVMDYRITDRYADPEGQADVYYSERLLRLPDSLCCYRPNANMPEPSDLPALSRGYLTFGSFNNFNKVDARTLALWAQLLRSIPNSRLMMLTVPEGEIRHRLEHSFADLGVPKQRLEFHGFLPAEEFHRKFHDVDISLDPIQVSGGTTTCESLWMGVPVLALAGERFITRVSYSFLHTAGLGDFAATTPDHYIHIAVHLADNLPLLAEIRAGLRGHLRGSPLTDEVGFTRNLEKLYRQMWVGWCGAT